MTKPISRPSAHPTIAVTSVGGGDWVLDGSARDGDGVEVTLKCRSSGGVIRLRLPGTHLLELAELAMDTPE